MTPPPPPPLQSHLNKFSLSPLVPISCVLLRVMFRCVTELFTLNNENGLS